MSRTDPYRTPSSGNPLLDAFIASDDEDAVAYREASARHQHGHDEQDLEQSRAALDRIRAKILPRSFDL